MSSSGSAMRICKLVALTSFRAELASSTVLRICGSTAFNTALSGSTVVNDRAVRSRLFATAPAGPPPEQLHVLHWPPRPEALAANPQLAYAVRSAAKHARVELSDRLNKKLKRRQGTWLSCSNLQSLQDVDIVAELQQCGLTAEDSRSDNLSTLFSILEQHQAAAPKQQEASPSSRMPEDPAVSSEAVESRDSERLPYAKIASPMEIANMLVAAKTDDVCILDVSNQCSFTEHMVLATGRSHRHIQAAASAIAYQMSLRCAEVAPGAKPRVEGDDGADWCVVDAGSVIVHVFNQEARATYDLDGLWSTPYNCTTVSAEHETLQSISSKNASQPAADLAGHG
ncbi:MAG: Iojap- mitochondrial-like [Trebouxia sp. A1-2]|nr:MAG: Iojap- mitochondrial-like [Trebouxia sp. A1-2]KAA6429885.1 MAG: Iojap- mitochondrial-like [Trebouxia sp. A1-2]